MKTLVLFPTGSLSATEKGRLSKEGFCAVECEAPSRVVTVIPCAPLVSGDDLLMAAMAGVCAQTLNDDKHHAAFVTELHRRMKARDAIVDNRLAE